MQGERRISRYWRVALALVAAIVALNALGFVTAFDDWYVTAAYPVLTEPFSRFFALVPFAVGEVVMLVGIAALVTGVVLAVLLAFLRKRAGFRRFVRGFWKFVLACVLVVGLLFTLNWAIPFRASPLAATVGGGAAAAADSGDAGGSQKTWTLEQLEELRTRIVTDMNEAAKLAPRDEDGHLAYKSTAAQNAQVAKAMQGLADEFPRLAGYYPAPKAALISDVLEWMGIGGYTYPYTEEITYNSHVSRLYYPLLAAHESAHHKGYFMESDAEFLAYLALSRSDDAILRYSACESVYAYVDATYRAALQRRYGSEDAAAAQGDAQVQLSDQVTADLRHDQQQRDAAYEASVNQGAEEAFSGAAKGASDAGWSAQSAVLQDNTYSGVVRLLLAYYYG